LIVWLNLTVNRTGLSEIRFTLRLYKGRQGLSSVWKAFRGPLTVDLELNGQDARAGLRASAV
jgi:hypothetical protein